MSWKDNIFGVQSFKSAISKWLNFNKGGSTDVKGRGLNKTSAFDIDGKHPLHKEKFEFEK